MTEVTLQNGEKVKLSGQSVEEYLAWRKDYINLIGHLLAAKFPEFYGKIGFNLQGGKFASANVGDSIISTPIDKSELGVMVEYVDELVKMKIGSS